MSNSFATRNGIACRNRFRRFRGILPGSFGLKLSLQIKGDSADYVDAVPPSAVSPFSENASNDSVPTNESGSEAPIFPSDLRPQPSISGEISPSFHPHNATSSSNQLIQPEEHSVGHLDLDQFLIPPDSGDALDQSWFDQFYAASLATAPAEAIGDDGIINNHGQISDSFFNPPTVKHSQDIPHSDDFMAMWLDHNRDLNSENLIAPLGQHQNSGELWLREGSPVADVAIENVWGLFMALESGKNSLHVSAGLIRQLLSDASKKL